MAGTKETRMSKTETLERPAGTNGSSRAELRTRAIEDQAKAMLRSSPYRSVQYVLCEVRQQVVTLRGRVPSFYMKQIAQTVLRDLLSDGLVIDNQVEVVRTQQTCFTEEMQCSFSVGKRKSVS
jgi:hypothetical protein